jgi:hypothetical protein
MTESELSREEDLRRLLTDAVEVQLAALKAGIGFWTEWIEETSKFVQSATETLSTIKAEQQQTKDVLLELVDASRASLRAMTEIPRHTATRFLDELDKMEQENGPPDAESRRRPNAGATTAAAARGGSKKAKVAQRPPARRAGRVKH